MSRIRVALFSVAGLPLAFLSAYSSVAHAGPVTLPLADSDLSKGPPISGVLPHKLLTVYGVTIGKDTFETVERRLGHATVRRNGPGEEAAKFLCYRAGDDAGSPAVIFLSGPLGSWDTITEVEVGRAGNIEDGKAICATSKRLTKAGSLELGMPLARLRSILEGKPNTDSSSEFEINYQVTRAVPKKVVEEANRANPGYFKNPAEATYDINSGLRAGLVNGRVSWFSVYRVESY